MSTRRLSLRWAGLASTILAFLVACANVAPPPGGEVDRKGPALLRSEPASGAVDVPISNRVQIFFSERIVEPLDKNVIFVSPRPPSRPRVKWHPESVEVELRDSFKINQTYIVSVASSVTDLRGNKLDSAVNVAFSTGPSMDSGQVSGYVFQDGKPFGGALVALYRMVSPLTQISYDSIYPDYIATSNSKGFFSLQYLPSAEFRMVGFIDSNHDERFNPMRELFAVPDREIKIGEGPLENIRLELTPFDTAAPKVVSIAYSSERLLRLRLSRAISFRDLNLDPGVSFLWQMPDSVNSFRAKALLESGDESGSILSLYFGDVPKGLYSLSISYQQGAPAIVADSIKVDSASDKVPPTVHCFYPRQSPVAARDLKLGLCFSEPLDTTFLSDQTFTLQTSTDSTIEITRRWSDPLHLDLKPTSVRDGSNYKLQVTQFEVIDRAGNAMGDSLKTYNFATLNPDSLGSISGEIVFKTKAGMMNGPIQLLLKDIANQNEYKFRVTDRTFKFEMPSGKYVGSGFVDSNLDGARSFGSPIPYTLSETRADFADTIAVRARFETAGIQFVFK